MQILDYQKMKKKNKNLFQILDNNKNTEFDNNRNMKFNLKIFKKNS